MTFLENFDITSLRFLVGNSKFWVATFMLFLLYLPMLMLISFVQKTSFMLFLNKFDIFEKKVLNVRASKICETFGHRWIITTYLGLWCAICVGAVECMRVVQRLPASFDRETRDWACVWVSNSILIELSFKERNKLPKADIGGNSGIPD